jgi:hypothetical protein
VKGPDNDVGRIVATIFSFGIYMFSWFYNQMDEPNKHFTSNWGSGRRPRDRRRCGQLTNRGSQAAGCAFLASGVLSGVWRGDLVLGRLDQFHGQVGVELVDAGHVSELCGDEGFVAFQSGGCDPE